MKKYSFILLLFISACAGAQFHLPFSNDLSKPLSQVISDVPNYFANIKADMLAQTPQTTDYACTVVIPNTQTGVVTRTGREDEHLYSWKNVLFESEDFAKAKAKFHQYYSDIKNTSASFNNSNLSLKASYEAPSEDKKFTTILFTIQPEQDELKKMVVDLSMQYQMSGWSVSVSVYEKDAF